MRKNNNTGQASYLQCRGKATVWPVPRSAGGRRGPGAAAGYNRVSVLITVTAGDMQRRQPQRHVSAIESPSHPQPPPPPPPPSYIQREKSASGVSAEHFLDACHEGGQAEPEPDSGYKLLKKTHRNTNRREGGGGGGGGGYWGCSSEEEIRGGGVKHYHSIRMNSFRRAMRLR